MTKRFLHVITFALALLLYAQQSAHATDPCSQHDQFWSHTYKPERLTVHKACVSVTGVIVDATAGKRKDGVRRELDGDTHGWLRVDAGQSQYLNDGNRTHEGGNLVFEVVCAFPVTQADALKACHGYASPIVIPPVGSHVKITGTWVMDDNHARWNEVHPVFAIEVLK